MAKSNPLGTASLELPEMPGASGAGPEPARRPPAPSGASSAFAPTDTFPRRHLGPSDAETAEMLELLGLGSLAALVDETVPAGIRLRRPLALAGRDAERPLGESELLALLRRMLAKNRVARSFLGMGYHGTIVPGVIQRNVL